MIFKQELDEKALVRYQYSSLHNGPMPAPVLVTIKFLGFGYGIQKNVDS